MVSSFFMIMKIAYYTDINMLQYNRGDKSGKKTDH